MVKMLSIILLMLVSAIQLEHTIASKCIKDDVLSDDLLDMMCKIRKTCNGGSSNEPTKKKRPAFTASITERQNLGPNQVLKFDKVWLNTGNVYNPKTGVFTVPQSGLYLISSSVMSNTGTHMHCHLWKNDKSNVGAFGTNYSQGTLNAVMELTKGDKLYMKHDKVTEIIYGRHWSMFSGYLITE